MAVFVRHGVQPSEFTRLLPGEARELLSRLEKLEDQDVRQRIDMQGEQVKALMQAIGQVVKAVDEQSKMLAQALSRRPTL